MQTLQAENAALRAADAGAQSWIARALLHAPFPAIVHADDGEVLALSDGFVQRTGYPRADIRHIDDWLVRAYGDRHAEVRDGIAERFRTGRVLHDAEVTIRAADGRLLRWVCNSSPPERLADGRYFAVVMAADVTAERATSDMIQESETRARLALDAARLGLWSWDPATDAGYQDARTKEILGLGPDESLTMSEAFARVIHPDDLPAVQAAVGAAADPAGAGRLDTTFRAPRPDGGFAWLRATAQARFEGTGDDRHVVHMTGTLEDVTEREAADRAVRESEARFRLLADAMPQLVFMLGPDGQATFFNGQFYRYTGEDIHEAAPVSRADYIHDDDRAPLIERWTEAAHRGEAFEYEYRLRRHDGAFRWHLMRAVPQQMEGAQGWIVSSTDIEALKEAQWVLEAREAQFRDLANSIPQLAWMADAQGWIFWYNARWYDYTGTTPEQMEGWGWQSVHDPEVLPRVVAQWEQSLADGTAFEMEFPLRGADGVFRPFLTRVAPLCDAEGRIVRWFGTNTDVSAIRTMEEALRTSETRFRALADAVPQIVYVRTDDGRLDYINARWFAYTGADPESDPEAYVHPDDLGRLHEAYAVAEQEGSPFEAELRLRSADGSYRWHLTRVTPVYDEAGVRRWYGTSTDIHDLRATREALAQQARLLDLSHDAIFVWHPDDGITYWNRGAADLYGYKRAEVLGRHARELLHTVLPTDAQTFWAQLERKREWIGMIQHTTKDGRTLQVESRWQLVPGPDGGTRVLESTRDVTARLEAETQLHALNAELHAVNAELQTLNGQLESRVARRTAELQEANRVLGVRNRELQDFAYVASHDLQEPLRKIRAFADLLLAEHATTLGDEPRHFLERMQDAASRMSRLIADLLAFSRVTTNAAPFTQVDLDETLRSALSDLEIRLRETGGVVEVNPDAGHARLPVVEADPVQMHQLLLNLVGNALKYRREGEAPRVVVTSAGDARRLVLKVADNGIGFEQRYAERMFAPFQRLHARSQYEGTGMGLAIVRRIVERHGGTVMAQGVPGEGSTFTVDLPIRVLPTSETTPEAPGEG